jgi:NAD-dependent deacetylase
MADAGTTEDQPSIVILTGAGISKESGLATFRDADGIWARYRIEDVATPEAYARDPERVLGFYNARRRGAVADGVHPNAAHLALARLEAEWPGDVLVVTQNIDDLHERAGSKNLIHMHGELLKARCTACAGVHPWRDDIDAALTDCALFLSIGTSGNVYPAAGFVQHVRLLGRARTMELNLEPSEGARLFEHARYGPASETVPAVVDDLLARGLAAAD